MIQFQADCSYSEKLDMFGSSAVDHRIVNGTVFTLDGTRDGAASYCGNAQLHAVPFGWMPENLCVATNGAVLVQRPQSRRIVTSDCRVAEPKPRVEAALANVGGKGAWKVDDTTSQLDGTRRYSATLVSSNKMPNAIGVAETATLIIRCRAGELSVYVAWPAFMGTDGQEVRWKFDQGEIWKQGWDASSDGTATFNPTPREFLTGLAVATHLVVNAAPYERENIEAVFDVTGANSIAATAIAACPAG
jgi:hypothetical protein